MGRAKGRDAALIESDAELIARLRGIVGLAGAAIMVRRLGHDAPVSGYITRHLADDSMHV